MVWLAFTTAPRSVANWARSWSLQDLPSIRFTDKHTDQRRFAARMSSVIATAVAAPPPGVRATYASSPIPSRVFASGSLSLALSRPCFSWSTASFGSVKTVTVNRTVNEVVPCWRVTVQLLDLLGVAIRNVLRAQERIPEQQRPEMGGQDVLELLRNVSEHWDETGGRSVTALAENHPDIQVGGLAATRPHHAGGRHRTPPLAASAAHPTMRHSSNWCGPCERNRT